MRCSTKETKHDPLIGRRRHPGAIEQERSRLQRLEPGERYVWVDRSGTTQFINTEDMDPAPRRSSGTVTALTAAGFVEEVTRRVEADAPYGLYADDDAVRITAILNDDYVLGSGGTSPGWRDYRVTYEPRRTPEWNHWIGHQGMKAQDAFAKVIEDGLPEIIAPDPATMLELAQTFEQNTNARFRQGANLSDGRRQYVFEEEEAGGTAEVPREFVLSVAPFVGSEPTEVTCRLRHKVREGKLSIGYDIVRPHEVEDASFAVLVGLIEAGLSKQSVEAQAPSARGAR